MAQAIGKANQDAAPQGVAAGRERFTAFVTDEASEKIVRQCVTDMALSYSSVHRGGIDRAIEHMESSRSPMALIVDVSGSEMPINDVQRLAEVCEPGVSVTIIGDRNDVGLYRDLVQAGISDYIVKPLTRTLVQTTIESLIGQSSTVTTPLSQKLGRVISVIGARGGVGSTTIAANLAWLLANQEKRRVTLVDLDVVYGDCALTLDVTQNGGLRDVLENPQRIDELFLERAMVRSGERLFVLGSEERLDVPLRIDPEALGPLFDLLRKQFHYVIVDVPRHNPEFLARMIELSNTRLVVVDQTPHSVRDVIRLRALLDAPRPGQRNLLVLNRAGEFSRNEIDPKTMSETIRLPLDFSIPYHPKSALQAANSGTPVASAGGPLAQALTSLVGEVSGRQGLGRAKKLRWFRR